MLTHEFVQEASVTNAFEIASGKLAMKAARNGDVFDFAKTVIYDHMETAERLRSALLAEDGVLRLDPAQKDPNQVRLDRLRGLCGEAFDAEYVRLQIEAHEEAVALFSSFSSYGAEGPVLSFARSTLPVLRLHKRLIEDIAAGFLRASGAAATPLTERIGAGASAVSPAHG